MANFIAIVDPEPERRLEFLKKVRARIALIPSLATGEIESGDFACSWAAGERAPVSRASGQSAAGVVFGDAIRADGGRVDARGLLSGWDPERSSVPPAYDGFFAAIRYDASHGLTVGSDVLGYFPVYYGCRDGVIIAGASPELFREHLLFPPRVSMEGLAGVLMVNAPVSGRSILEGITRLSWGHALRWTRADGPREVRQYSLPSSGDENESFQDSVRRMDAAFESAVGRHVPAGEMHGLLLSGGRDSRLVAGYASENGCRFDALTFGRQDDYDATCARAVADRLVMSHRTVELAESRFGEAASIQAAWEHLAGGFASIHMWEAIDPVGQLPARVATAYGLETRAGEPLPFDFDGMMNLKKHRGVARPMLRRLLRDAGAVDTVESELRATHAGYSDDGNHRWWRFYLDHDWRSHAGGVPWKLSFAAWPAVPVCDRGVMDVIATLPAKVIANRAVHDEILRTRFPRLARLPLDRNNHDLTPLIPSRFDLIRERVAQSRRRRMSRMVERRYYHRVYDINGAGWKEVRRLAEPHRERLADLVSMEVLRELVPPPDEHVEVENKVRDTFGMKLLIGLMLWSGTHIE